MTGIIFGMLQECRVLDKVCGKCCALMQTLFGFGSGKAACVGVFALTCSYEKGLVMRS
jgi:hypothetical protein